MRLRRVLFQYKRVRLIISTEGAEKSKKREAAEAEAILHLCVPHKCKIAELPLNAAEQENDMRKQEQLVAHFRLRLDRAEFAGAGEVATHFR